MNEKYKDGDWLRRKHHHEMLSIAEVAAEAGVSSTTITRWMRENEIDRIYWNRNQNIQKREKILQIRQHDPSEGIHHL